MSRPLERTFATPANIVPVGSYGEKQTTSRNSRGTVGMSRDVLAAGCVFLDTMCAFFDTVLTNSSALDTSNTE
jgi:hypothetical protein